ncbi:MAG: TonB-dependent receptor plug domain-containing protein, partial [Bacteroidota bacterium]
MSLRHHAVLTAACLLGSVAAARAQHCHSALRGHITEGNQRDPLAYATVFVKEAGKSTLSDESGYFEIIDLCEDSSYTVEVSHVECAHLVQIVRVRENTTFDFNLDHDAVLKEVIIVEKALAPAPVQAQATLGQADLEAARGTNLAETLRKLPGVSVLSTGATIGKPVIQGLHSNRIALVNNNVVLESQQWGREHAPEIDPFSAGKIMVVKGAAGVRYGPGAMGGAVIIEPEPFRKQDGWGGWVSTGIFSNGRGAVLSGSTDWHKPGSSLVVRAQGTLKRSGNLRAPDYFLHNTGLQEYNASAAAAWKKNRREFECGL